MPLSIAKFLLWQPANGDIFQYHAELQDQIKLVKAQGETLGLNSTITPWVEQGLLLVAAWQHPTYRKLALDFTMDDKAVSCDLLVKELQKLQLLTSHLNQSGGERRERPKFDGREVRVRVATTAPVRGVCFNFKKGSCSRGADCPFSHEKQPCV